MTLRYTYTLFAPIYDAFVAPFTARARRDSLRRLREGPHADVLLVGVGSGLDLPLLPQGPRYTGLDLTPAMLARARRKAADLGLDIRLDQGDARRLPYGDATFDAVVLHLILAVTPHPRIRPACGPRLGRSRPAASRARSGAKSRPDRKSKSMTFSLAGSENPVAR